MIAQSGSSSGSRSGGFGIGFGINIFPRRVPVTPQEPDVSEPPTQIITSEDDDERTSQRPRRETARAAQPKPTRKLAKPRVPYLTEIAMDIDTTLVQLVRDEPRQAIEIYRKLLATAEKSKDAAREKESAINLGHVYYLSGRLTESVASYSRALLISKRMTDPTGEALAHRNIAGALTAAGDFYQAQSHNENALKFFQKANKLRDQQMTLNNFGVLEKNRARYSQSLYLYQTALAIRQESDAVQRLVLRNLGNLFGLWGEYDKSVDHLAMAAELSIRLEDYSQAGDILLDAAQIHDRSGKTQEALQGTETAMQIFARGGLATDWSKKLMGDLLLDSGKVDEAEKYIQDADYDSSLGRLYLVRGQPEAAKKHFEQLLQAAQMEGNLDELFAAHTGLGKVFEATNAWNRAEEHYSKAVQITEDIRSSLLLAERKNFFAAKISGFPRAEPAKGLVSVTLKQKKPERSIYPSETIRAREFADNLARKVDNLHFGLPADVLEQEAHLADRVASLKRVLGVVPKTVDNQRYADLSKEAKKAEEEYRGFIKSLRGSFGDYCAVKHPSPVKLDKADIRPDEYVLMYDIIGDGVAFRLLKGKKILKASLLEWNSRDLETDVRKFREPLEQVQLAKFRVELAESLHKRLTASMLDLVPEGSPLLIIPDGILALLPFEALVIGGKPQWLAGKQGPFPHGITYLGDRNPVIYSQSLTAMTLARARAKKEKTGSAVLVMADPVFNEADERTGTPNAQKPTMETTSATQPDRAARFNFRRLKESQELGNSLKSLYGESCEVYTGFQCSKGMFLNRVSGRANPYKFVVFGTHGFPGNDTPTLMEPFLALTLFPKGTDGFLTMTEVAGLKMNVEIAALTACNTGVGSSLAGEGVMSMGRAFQCAGAKTVIMSLWSVAEAPSLMLMSEFFGGIKQGLGKVEAWSRSKALIRQQGFEHPFFWSSFVLVGEKD
jgi:CHAT domain-containing protein